MSIIHEIRHQDHMGTRVKRAALLVLYAVLILAALYLFSRRWSAFAPLVPPVAVVVAVLFILRIVHVMRFRHGERRQQDRRHTDRRDQLEESGSPEPVRGASSAGVRRQG